MPLQNLEPEWLPLPCYAQLKAFLEGNGLRWEGTPDRAAVVREEKGILASAAIQGDVIKYVAVSQAFREFGYAAKLVSALIEDAFSRGQTHLFLFTTADKAQAFQSLGFKKICEYDAVALLEYGRAGIEQYRERLKKYAHEGLNGAIVMNANPFTLGHRYLIEKAAAAVDRLHVFLVREDASAFPYEARLQMVQNGAADIKNIFIHRGGTYILSHVTFPSYFIKEQSAHACWQAGLDTELFKEHIAPAARISVRFVGSEPLDETTNAYNQKMKSILIPAGIGVTELERLKIDGEIVSASRVRGYLRRGEFEKALSLVPPATRDFIVSGEGQRIVGRLKQYEN